MSAPALAQPAATAPRLHLDAATHTYTFGGQVVPGVTSVLRRAGIIDYTGIPQHVLDRAAERGRHVHVALDYHDRGTLDRTRLDSELEPYVKAYEKFCADSGFIPGLAERSRANLERWYAGTFDRVGLFEGSDVPVVLDFKSGMYFEGHLVQVNAYTNFFPNPRRFRQIALQLKPDGSYDAHEAPACKFDYHRQIFIAALACVRFAGETRRS